MSAEPKDVILPFSGDEHGIEIFFPSRFSLPYQKLRKSLNIGVRSVGNGIRERGRMVIYQPEEQKSVFIGRKKLGQ
ncbi:hypothetical protein TNCT_625141 [Trichonephila clavata]|uniref:Uncharacterized protein n=1 Tax=Trichonephila clavata TaxID=2740835 RepID=A0A8X6G8N9_TRICU|nr:hypothetical protein TNCT_625141 [Trichonephila clavata]